MAVSDAVAGAHGQGLLHALYGTGSAWKRQRVKGRGESGWERGGGEWVRERGGEGKSKSE